MRKMRDEMDLNDRFEEITAMDFRKSPGEVLDSVRLGKTFLITKQGKPMGVISPLPGKQLTIVINGDGSKTYEL